MDDFPEIKFNLCFSKHVKNNQHILRMLTSCTWLMYSEFLTIIFKLKLHKRNLFLGPGCMAQLVGALFCAPGGRQFDSWSGHMPRLWVRSMIGVHAGGNQPMFLSLSLSLEKLMDIFLGED